MRYTNRRFVGKKIIVFGFLNKWQNDLIFTRLSRLVFTNASLNSHISLVLSRDAHTLLR